MSQSQTTLYNSLVYPYLTYGLLLWGSMAKIHTNKIFTLQKRAVRIIAGSTFTAYTEPLFHEFSILKLDELYKLFLGIYIYKQKNQLYPQPVKRDIPQNSDFHSYNTRHRNEPRKPKVRTKLFADSFYNRAIDYWSVIPDEAKNFLNIRSFLSCLRNIC